MPASSKLDFRQAIGGAIIAASVLGGVALADDGGRIDRPRALLGDNGLMLDLSGHGLQSVADVVRRELLNGPQEMALPDLHRPLLGGVELAATGIKLSFQIRSLSVVPKDGALALSAEIQDLRVRVDEMRMQKNILGFPIKASCSGTEFQFGSEDTPARLSSDIEAAVIDRNIILGSRNTAFPVSSENYHVQGPQACSGGIFVREILGFAVHTVLSHAHPFIEKLVVKQVSEKLPGFGEKLTEQTNLSLTVDIHDMPPIPERMLTISAYPHRLAIKPDSLQVVVGMDFRDEELFMGRAAPKPRALVGGLRLGSLGVNPHLLTELLQVLFAEGSPEIEIDSSVFPQIQEVLKIESASAIWPDLTTLETPEDHLRVFASMKSIPEIRADEASQSVQIHAPQIDLRFVAHQGGDWQDYFNLQLDVKAGIVLSIMDGVVALSVAPGGTIGVAGDWAPSYAPQIKEWERDVAAVLFSVLLEYMVGQGPLFRIDVPNLEIGGLRIALDKPKVVPPFIRIDLIEAE